MNCDKLTVCCEIRSMNYCKLFQILVISRSKTFKTRGYFTRTGKLTAPQSTVPSLPIRLKKILVLYVELKQVKK